MPPRTGSLEERLKSRMEAERRRLGLAAKEAPGVVPDIGAGLAGAAKEAPGVVRDIGTGYARAFGKGVDILTKPLQGTPLKEYPKAIAGGLRDIAAGDAKAIGKTIKAIGEYTPIGEPRQAPMPPPTTQAWSADAAGLASHSPERRAEILRQQEAPTPSETAASGLGNLPPEDIEKMMYPGVSGQGRVYDPATKQFVNAPSMAVAGAAGIGGAPATGLRGGIYQATPAATSMEDYAQQRAATNALMQTGAGSTKQEQQRAQQRAARTEGLATQRRASTEDRAEQARLDREMNIEIAQIGAGKKPSKKLGAEELQHLYEQQDTQEFTGRQIEAIMSIEIPTDRRGNPTKRMVWSKNANGPVLISNREYEKFQVASQDESPYLPLNPDAQRAADYKARGIEFEIDAQARVRRI